ncbi:MAG: ComF family protein [Actinomycetia bacterium]|nr:ComF family protein [Actinomycetes bacterium]
MRWVARALVELVLPKACVGCGAPGELLCAACAPSGAAFPVRSRRHWVRVFAAARYDGGVRAALLAYKERGRRELADRLAGLLVDPLTELIGEHRDRIAARAALGETRGPPAWTGPASRLAASVPAARPAPGAASDPAGELAPVLVPVPSVASLARARGGDHVARLARGASACTGLPVARALRLARPVRDSAGLDSVARARNVHGAMAAAAPPVGVRFAAVIVDDIVTTGATFGESARALTAAGWPVLGAVAVAATPSRGERPDSDR